MAPIILYMVPTSPACRAVLMVAKALDISVTSKVMRMIEAKEHLQEAYLQMNPNHTIPTIDDNGFYVYESGAIMGYLVDKYGKNDDLYPKDLHKRTINNQILHYSNVAWIRIYDIFGPYYIEEIPLDQIPQCRFEKVKSIIESLERIIDNKRFATGDKPTIADFSIFSWITSWEAYEPLDQNIYPNIKSWIKRMEKVPGAEANKTGLKLLYDCANARRGKEKNKIM